MDKGGFLLVAEHLLVQGRARDRQLTRKPNQLAVALVGCSDITVSDIAKYDRNLAGLLENAQKGIREVDAYIVKKLEATPRKA